MNVWSHSTVLKLDVKARGLFLGEPCIKAKCLRKLWDSEL